MSSPRLTVTLQGEPGHATMLRFTVHANESGRLCLYQTPFEGFAASILDVRTTDGHSVAYLGRMVKRRPPNDSDLVRLEAGEHRTTTFDLAQHYAIESGTRYTVRFKGNPDLNGLPDSNVLEISAP